MFCLQTPPHPPPNCNVQSDPVGISLSNFSYQLKDPLSLFFFTWFMCLCTGKEAVEEPNRIWGEKCSRSDIVIDQGPTSPLPSGIPTYTVEIMNVCVTGCNISRIHLNCGWFSSATLVNPRVFKRLRYNDCLVNDGKPLVNGGTISFEYANTFLYPLKVSSVACYW